MSFMMFLFSAIQRISSFRAACSPLRAKCAISTPVPARAFFAICSKSFLNMARSVKLAAFAHGFGFYVDVAGVACGSAANTAFNWSKMESVGSFFTSPIEYTGRSAAITSFKNASCCR